MCVQIDLLPSEQAVQAVESAIRTHNSEVDIMRTTHCSLDISHILDKGAFAGSKQNPSQLQQLQSLASSIQLLPQHAASHADVAEAHTSVETHHDNYSTLQAGEHAHTASSEQPLHREPQAASKHQHEAHASHEHSHSHAGHLESVRSISLVHPGQVDLFRYSTCNPSRSHLPAVLSLLKAYASWTFTEH